MSYHVISYHIKDLKWQNHLKVGTDKPYAESQDAVIVRWWFPYFQWMSCFCFPQWRCSIRTLQWHSFS